MSQELQERLGQLQADSLEATEEIARCWQDITNRMGGDPGVQRMDAALTRYITIGITLKQMAIAVIQSGGK